MSSARGTPTQGACEFASLRSPHPDPLPMGRGGLRDVLIKRRNYSYWVMLDWYRQLGADERRTFWACFGGWALDALDVQIYTFAIPALIAVWQITKAQAGLLATSALVISAFGGWIAGMFADRVGRARLLSIMIAWFAFFTFLSGFTQNFEQLLVVRRAFRVLASEANGRQARC